MLLVVTSEHVGGAGRSGHSFTVRAGLLTALYWLHTLPTRARTRTANSAPLRRSWMVMRLSRQFLVMVRHGLSLATLAS